MGLGGAQWARFPGVAQILAAENRLVDGAGGANGKELGPAGSSGAMSGLVPHDCQSAMPQPELQRT